MTLLLLRFPVRFRVESALAFIEESGRFQPAISGLPPERPLIASVMFKDVQPNRARITAVVHSVRARHGPKLKAADLDVTDDALVGDLVKDVGLHATAASSTRSRTVTPPRA